MPIMCNETVSYLTTYQKEEKVQGPSPVSLQCLEVREKMHQKGE